MQSKKIIVIYSVFLLFSTVFSGCILDDLFSISSSYELKGWDIVDTKGFPSVYLDFDSEEKIYLKTYNSNGELIDWEYFYGSDNTTLNIGSYHETLSSTSVRIEVFDGNEKVINDKAKELSINGPNLEILMCYYNVWKTRDKLSLVELQLILYNNGDCPVYPESLEVSYNDKKYIGNILPCTVEPDSYQTTYSYVYVENINNNDNFSLQIFDKDISTLAQKNLKFDNFNYCQTATFSSGVDNPLSVPVPEFLFSYYDNHEQLIIDDYAAFVFDKYDDSYLSLFLDLFIENIDNSALFDLQSDPDRINEIASFVQNLDYIADYKDGDEEIEDPQYPIETLFRNRNCGGGDCEDKAILMASLLDMIGYDVSLIRIPNHMAVGVSLSKDALDEEYYSDNYYFLDTSPQDLGKVFSKYKDPSELDLYKINSRPFIDHHWRNGSITSYIESSGRRNIKVVFYVENLGNITADCIRVDAVFYTDTDLEINKKTTSILEIYPYTKKKGIIEADAPIGTSFWFDTRIYLDDELVSKKTSDKKFLVS